MPVKTWLKDAPGGKIPPIDIGPRSESVTETPVSVTFPVLVMTNLNIGFVGASNVGPGNVFASFQVTPLSTETYFLISINGTIISSTMSSNLN